MDAIQPFFGPDQGRMLRLLGERADFRSEGQHLRGLAAEELQPVRLMRFQQGANESVLGGCAGAGKVDDIHIDSFHSYVTLQT